MIPFRIEIVPIGPGVDVTENVRANRDKPPPIATGRRRLAVVGGSPSVGEHLDELKQWDGDVWGINSTAYWLQSKGIDCALFTVDPLFNGNGTATKAILASCCHPDLVNACDSSVFHLIEQDPDGVIGGCTTAGRAPILALRLGYTEVHFFGCEGSFSDTTHIEWNETVGFESQLLIKAGETYKTAPELLKQCEELGGVIRAFPTVFFERSGGLLGAMLRHWDEWEVVAVSDGMKADLIARCGDIGLYEKEYADV